LLVAGGSDFPISLFEGGTKQWFADTRVLPPNATAWSTPAALPQALGYGVSISYKDGLICIGGSDGKTHTNAVFRLRWKQGVLCRSELPALPKTCANFSGALLGDVIYVSGGQETPVSPTSFNNLWALDMMNLAAGWKELAAPPSGQGRILPVMAAQNGAIYLISGASLAPDANGKPVRTYLRDAWRFSPKSGWMEVASPPWATVAAPAAAHGKHDVLVFGGSDGTLDARVQELKEKHPGFHREVLAYNTKDNAWRVVSTLPVGLVTTNAVKLGRDIVIPGGEDRPGHRNPRVLRYSME
jgi:N-acetylneuraminic acid mutarotase